MPAGGNRREKAQKSQKSEGGARLANKPKENVLFCSSKRAARKAEALEIILDDADGLNWETLCKCDLVFAVTKGQLKQKRASVTLERRRQIAERLVRALGLAGM